MKIGCVKEIKRHEYRVGLTPQCVAAYTARGHHLVIQEGAGMGAGFADAEYVAAGAAIEAEAATIFAGSDMIVKVKEPLPTEYNLLREGQILYTYLHLVCIWSPTKFRRARSLTGKSSASPTKPSGQRTGRSPASSR